MCVGVITIIISEVTVRITVTFMLAIEMAGTFGEITTNSINIS